MSWDRTKVKILYIFIVIMAFPGLSFSEVVTERPQDLVGKITCENEVGWPNIAVYLLKSDDSLFLVKTKTNQDGEYIFKDIWPGDTYLIKE